MNLVRHSTVSKIAAISLLLAVVAVIYLVLIQPLYGHYLQNHQQAAKLTRQIASYEHIAENRSRIEQLFESMRPDEERTNYYLQGSTRALASAELQAYVRTVIESSEGSLLSTQPIVRDDDAPERVVKVNVRMSGSVEALVQVLYRVANGFPVLLTDDVLIMRERSAVTRKADDRNEGDLEIHFTLTGFVKESVL